MLSSEALPDLNHRLDALQEQAVAKLLEKVGGSRRVARTRLCTSQQACWHWCAALHAHSSTSAQHCPSSPLPSSPSPSHLGPPLVCRASVRSKSAARGS